tara:strand:- start:1131 stop:1601 length:471 start_codon:yes stop_codon:yes gene_type:complete
MKKHSLLKFKTKKVFHFKSRIWIWPIWAGICFGLGYSMPKNFYLSKSQRKQTRAKFQTYEEFLGTKKNLFEKNQKNSNLKKINGSSKYKKNTKIIFSPSLKDMSRRLTISYSEDQNLKNQAVFKNNQKFFAKEKPSYLLQSLKNTNITKSSKVEAD